MPDTVTGLVTTEPGPGERIMIASSGRRGGTGLPTVAVGGAVVAVGGAMVFVGAGAVIVNVGGGGSSVSVGGAVVSGNRVDVAMLVTAHAVVIANNTSREIRRIDLMISPSFGI